MCKYLREIHLEKYALRDDRIVRTSVHGPVMTRIGPMRPSRCWSFAKSIGIRLDRSHVPSERCHSRGRVADPGTDFQNPLHIAISQPSGGS